MKIKKKVGVNAFFLISMLAAVPVVASEQNQTLLSEVIKAVGGQQAISQLGTLEYSSWGRSTFYGQSRNISDPLVVTGRYLSNVKNDFEHNAYRIDYYRDIVFPFSVTLGYAELIVGDDGVLLGADNAAGIPTPRPMSSLRVAATDKRLRLFNPLRLLKDIVNGRHFVSEQVIDNEERLLILEGDIASLRLHIDENGLMSKLTTFEHSHALGDIAYEIRYKDWQSVPNSSLMFPHLVEVFYNGEKALKQRHFNVSANTQFDRGTLVIPSELSTLPPLDILEYERGQQTHHFHQAFTAIGSPAMDVSQSQIVASELSSGVFYLQGGTHHSMLVEQEHGLVLVEAPLHEERSKALQDWIDSQFPTKPITHVVMSHYHFDHSGGVRHFIANDVNVVLSEKSIDFVHELASRPRTIRPDNLSISPKPLNMINVPNEGRITLADRQNPVTLIHHENTPHAEDLLLVFLPEQKMLFTADVYSPQLEIVLPAERPYLVREIDTEQLDVETIVGSHGGIGSMASLRVLVEQE